VKGKFSKFDIVVILAVIAVIAVGGYYYFGKESKSLSHANTEIEFDVAALNLSLQEAQSFKEQEGGSVIFGKTNMGVGKIKSVKIEPYSILAKDIINGERRWVDHPENYQAIVTIEKKVLETDDVFIGDKEEIRIGELTPIKGKGFGCSSCYVTDLRVLEN